jgi:hypothetical protein
MTGGETRWLELEGGAGVKSIIRAEFPMLFV